MLRVQKEKIRCGRKENMRFEDKGEAGVLHWKRGPNVPGNTVELYKLEESEEEVTVLLDMEFLEESGAQ